jgi:hypothetical protein
MASSRAGSATAFPAEVARFLLVSPADVQRMVRLDRLPAMKVPMSTRTVLRFYLPDLHRWLVGRSDACYELRNYADFLERFDRVRAARFADSDQYAKSDQCAVVSDQRRMGGEA